MPPSPRSSRRSPFLTVQHPTDGVTYAALALASVTVASAQGRCGGDRAGSPACDTTPVKAPFAPTGWQTVALDHFSVQATDYKKEAVC